MSILIKGMELPESCSVCPLLAYCSVCEGYQNFCMPLGVENGYTDYPDTDLTPKDSRRQDCPLVEVPTPHGRLIDADELRQEWLDADNVTYEVNDVLNSIDYAPTIIEAEE